MKNSSAALTPTVNKSMKQPKNSCESISELASIYPKFHSKDDKSIFNDVQSLMESGLSSESEDSSFNIDDLKQIANEKRQLINRRSYLLDQT